jgi:phage gpG-like protein
MARKADDGGRAAADAMGRQAQQEIRRQLAKRSHAPRTPTPSPPGQPPARISGALSASVTATAPQSAGAYRWVSRVGPHIVYGPIQDRGGVAGRNHATTLPPRPYMAPAHAEGGRRISEAGQRAFRRVVLG